MDPINSTHALPYARELHIANLAVNLAVALTRKVLTNLRISTLVKTDNTPVTIADFASQAVIISIMHHYFPSDCFIAEEDAGDLKSDPGLLESVWELVSSMR